MITRLASLNRFVAISMSVGAVERYSSRNTIFCEHSTKIVTETPKIVLYQYKICPFCNRVKAYLDYLKIDYESVEVNPLTKSEISFSKDYKKVPIAIINGDIHRESSNIIDYVTKTIISKKVLASDFFPSDTEKWSEWSEKRLAVYLYPNITRSYSESWECFSYANEIATWNKPMQMATQVAGSVAMTLANGKIKKKYNIVDERGELNNELKLWIDAVGSKKFLHGDKITMPDVMVYGVLRSIQGLTTFKEIMETNTNLKMWYERVDTLIRPSN